MRRGVLCLAFGLFLGGTLRAQPLATATIVAGRNNTLWPYLPPYSGGPAANAPFGFIQTVAVDSDDNVYFLDQDSNSIGKIAPGGTFTLLAGYALPLVPVIPNTSGSIYPGIAVDKNKNVYFSEPNSFRIRMLTPAGAFVTVAGTGTAGYSGDGGPATAARVNNPMQLAMDGAGNLYFSDTTNKVIRKIDTNGIIKSVAGGGSLASPAAGGSPATSLSLGFNDRIAVDTSGNLFVADGNRLLTIVGGTATLAFTAAPTLLSVAVDSHGVVYVTTLTQVLKLGMLPSLAATQDKAVVVAGMDATGFSGDGGPALSARFNLGGKVDHGRGGGNMAFDSAGNLYLADSYNSRIRKVTLSSAMPTVTTFAGNGLFMDTGDGGPATQAFLNSPEAIGFDPAGNLFVAERQGSRIRKIDSSGTITAYAGNGSPTTAGDGGSALNASINQPLSLAVSPAGDVYVGDISGPVRKITPQGAISSFAVIQPLGLAVNSRNIPYVAANGFAYELDPITGSSTIVAGTGITLPADGDGKPAVSVSLDPAYLAFTPSDDLLMPDSFNRRLYELLPSGILKRLAGNGTTASGDGGPAASASFSGTGAIAADLLGNIYILDSRPNKIRKISPNGFINTVLANALVYCLTTDREGRLYGCLTQGVIGIDSIARFDPIPPVVSTLSPPSVIPGSGPFTLTITGSNFDVDSVVRWKGLARTTVYVSSTTLKAAIPPSDVVAAGSAAITVYSPGLGGSESAPMLFPIASQPSFSAAGVVNAASFQGSIAPGSLISIFGAGLADTVAGAAGLPLPATLSGVTVSLNASLLPLLYVSPSQINAQVPLTASGTASLLIQPPGRGSSPPVTSVPAGPGIFVTSSQQGAILNSDYTLADAANPARAGSVVAIYCTGLGAVATPIAAGAAAPNGEDRTVLATRVLLNASTEAVVTYAGLSPGYAGLYQVNFQVPAGLPAGSTNVRILVDGVSSNTVTMSVQP